MSSGQASLVLSGWGTARVCLSLDMPVRALCDRNRERIADRSDRTSFTLNFFRTFLLFLVHTGVDCPQICRLQWQAVWSTDILELMRSHMSCLQAHRGAHVHRLFRSFSSDNALGKISGRSRNLHRQLIAPHKNEQLCTSFSKWSFEKAPCSERLFKPFNGPVTAW